MNMAKEKREWAEIPEFTKMAQELIDKFPEKLGDIDSGGIVCYGITNKDKPETCKKRFDLAGGHEPECFTNTKKAFVTFYQSDWDQKTEEQKYWLVFDALRSLDASAEPWKTIPNDYVDRAEMVRTLGADWESKEGLPHPLKDKINFRE